MVERDPRNQQRKVNDVHEAVRQLLATVLRNGFYGKGRVVISVENGVIQGIWRKTKQVEK